MKIRVIIVDDEPLARQRVRQLLAEVDGAEIVAECANGREALAAVRQKRPDLLFLDVQMPKLGGFDVLRALDPAETPLTIFVTAHDQYAIRAFDAHALDYLLKPFREQRFHQAMDRARAHLASHASGEINDRLAALLRGQPPARPRLSRVAVKTPDRVFFLKAEEIDWIEAAGNYVVLHVGSESHVLRETLAQFERQLAPEDFVRISRSAIANVNRIKELQPSSPGEYTVILETGARLPMTRGIRDLQQLLRFR